MNEPIEGAERFNVATVVEKQVYVNGHWVTMKDNVIEWALVACFDKERDAYTLTSRLHGASQKMYVYDKNTGKDVLTPQTK